MDGGAELEELSRTNSSRESSQRDVEARNSIRSSSGKLSVKIKDEKKRGFDSESIASSGSATGTAIDAYPPPPPHKVPNKIIANWRHACDKTRDRTRDLLKRWRTLPEFDPNVGGGGVDVGGASMPDGAPKAEAGASGWSVHVWTTWVDRFSIDMETVAPEGHHQLTPIQANKFTHFFRTLLDHDQDELINEQDIETLVERLRHFADWDTYSPEYNILREIERGFIATFLSNFEDEKIGFEVNKQAYLTIEGWLCKWSTLIAGARNLADFPIWLQYFVKVLFQVVNRSGSGVVTRDELSAFYSSVLCLDTTKVGEILDVSYQAMTSNGDHALNFKAYRLCFANYLLGRYPNGPGQYIFGAPPLPMASALFPVDYSALNAQPEDLEQYAPDGKTTRRSVIV